jgi:hypothetical protein
MDMFFILGTLAQVVVHPKEKEKPPREPLDVLLLSHNLKRSARSFKSISKGLHLDFAFL